MNKTEIGRLEQLERRAMWLKHRSENYTGKNPSYDKAELSAILWAINIIKRYFLKGETK